MICDNCKGQDTIIKDYMDKYTIKDKTIIITSKRRFCKSCNSLVYDNKLDNETMNKVLLEYNKKYGIDNEKIKEIRKEFNLTLDEFSKILGCAKKTLISYEKGLSIPNDNYINIINSLIYKPDIIDVLLESNKYKYNDSEYNKIKTKILKFLSNNTININNNILDIYNGYTIYDNNKLINMILFLSSDGILKTKLMKELFYVDFISYKYMGKSISGSEYIKYTYGPVLSNKDQIISYCIDKKNIEEDIKYHNNYEEHLIKGIKKYNKDIFTKEEIDVLNKVKKHFQKYSVKRIVDLSHKEKAYINTNFSNKISYEYAFDIDIL